MGVTLYYYIKDYKSDTFLPPVIHIIRGENCQSGNPAVSRRNEPAS